MYKLIAISLSVLFLNAVHGQDPAPDTQIKELKKIKPKEVVFRDATRVKPVVIANKKAASKYFEKEDVAKRLKFIDFDKQVLFVFAWRGSGQDEMSYHLKKDASDESNAAEVEFTFRPGRTRDLRPHTKVYAIEDDVLWNGKSVRHAKQESAGSK
jgi:hypothetical protein